ncbi:hypothetical protein Pyn_05760 [Prunus yedoensis var. nudiflora]|uniref:Uncharacterized protein n=1 Tax=Prunus yedoensis var. nudiflora TaxID=2094558 RepID=A0A314YRV5_PRUYE|nr:hypothetical protein Pyn_05760 [Prunus yedoensis var. nudiflora]
MTGMRDRGLQNFSSISFLSGALRKRQEFVGWTLGRMDGISIKDESGSSRSSTNFGVLDDAWHRLGDRPRGVGARAGAAPSVVEVPSSSNEGEGEAEVGE